MSENHLQIDQAPPSSAGHSNAAAAWRGALEPYAAASTVRSSLDVLSSVGAYLALSVGMYYALRVSVLFTLALAVPAAGFLVRTFIVFHDCTHGSFFRSRRANLWLGTLAGLLLWSPFVRWRHDHAVHHATAGDLERRGVGDVRTLTVREYSELDARAKRAYRLLRNPLIMFGLGPIAAMIVGPRMVARDAHPRMRRNVIRTDVALAGLVAGFCLLVGWRAYLLIAGPAALLAGSAGIWLFYVQHQFEQTYWKPSGEWNYLDAALKGSSFLKLPGILRFFSGNIGYHHVHHLNARIPNYNLPRAHAENPDLFENVPELSMRDGLRAVRLKLWDEESGRLVGFAEAERIAAGAPCVAGALAL